jgi:hypothetical protein
MPPHRRALTEDEVIASGAWHPRYARVIAIASDGDYGLAIVDGNGDGAELEAETWEWNGERWTSAGSAGAGALDTLGPWEAGQIGNSYCAYGSAPGRQTIMIDFDGRFHQTPVSRYGVWAFIRASTSPGSPGIGRHPGQGSR